MGRSIATTLAWCCLALAGAAMADNAGLRKYPLPGHGVLAMRVPPNWQDETRPAPDGGAPTLSFSPKSGAPFQVLVTPYFQTPKVKQMPKLPEVRAAVEAAAQRVKPHAVENAIPLKPFKQGGISGYYFSATDQKPRPGAFRHMTQGMLRAGALAPTFTIFTQDGDQAVEDAAFAMLASIRHEPSAK